jgi:hypothetical protein
MLPGPTGNQAPFVQPRLQAFCLQRLRDALHKDLIGAVIGEEDIEIGRALKGRQVIVKVTDAKKIFL